MLQELGVYIPDEEMPDLVTQLDPQLEGKIQFDRLLPWFKEMNALTADTPAYMEEDADEGKK